MPNVPLAKSVLKVAMQGRRPAAAFILDNAAWASVSKHPGYITPSRRCKHTINRSTASDYLFRMRYSIAPNPPLKQLCCNVVVTVVPHTVLFTGLLSWVSLSNAFKSFCFFSYFSPRDFVHSDQGAVLCNIIETGLSAERVAIFGHCNTNINQTGAPRAERGGRLARPSSWMIM